MAYRTYVNGVQLFGNNDIYGPWLEFIRSQGITISPDEYAYDGEITDFMGAVRACEKCVREIMADRAKDRKEIMPGIEKYLAENPGDEAALRVKRRCAGIWDFSGHERDLGIQTVLDLNFELIATGYAFMPFALYLACRDLIEPEDPERAFMPEPGSPSVMRTHNFRLKPGCTIKVRAG